MRISARLTSLARQNQWKPRWAVGGATGIVVLASAAALSAWPSPDFGTVPAWVSAGGAVATFVSVAVAVQSLRRQQRSELEDQAAQVRLLELRIRLGDTPLFDGSPYWKASRIGATSEFTTSMSKMSLPTSDQARMHG